MYHLFFLLGFKCKEAHVMGQVGAERRLFHYYLLTVPSSNPIPIYSKSHDWVAVSNHTSLQLPINMSNYANQSYSDSVQPRAAWTQWICIP